MRGKLTVATLVLLAILAATIAWWRTYERGHHVLQLWGSNTASLIRLAKHVEIARLWPEGRWGNSRTKEIPPADSPDAADDRSAAPAPREDQPGDPSDTATAIRIGTQVWSVAATKDISSTHGLVHARQALIEDASYDWDAPTTTEPRWEYLLTFRRGDESCQLAVAPGDQAIVQVGSDRLANIQPISAGLATFCAEQFRATAPVPSAAESRPPANQ